MTETMVVPMRRGILSGVLLLVLAGCFAPPDGATVVDFWGIGREGEVVKDLVPEFERQNPGIRVRVQQIPWTAAHEKLLTAFVGDTTPDISQLGNTWIPEFVALEALESLDSWVETSGIVERADYFPGIWDTNVIDKMTYGVPWYVDTRLMFYRKDALARAGFEAPPETWDEWLVAMERIKQQACAGNYAILLPTNEWEHPIVFGLQTGSTLLRDEDRYGDFRGAEFRRAFEFFVDLYRRDLAPVLGNTMISNVYQEFARGYYAIYLTGPWNIGEFRRRLPEDLQDQWMTAPMPGPDGPESGVSVAFGSSVVMFNRSEKKEAAWKFVEFLSAPEQQVRFHEMTGNLPAREAAWDDEALSTNIYADAFHEQLQRAVPVPKLPEWERITDKVKVYAEAAARGDMTIDVALTALDRDVDAILEKRRWLMGR
jgi:multiple sugar transport system substrate-binding protein